MVASSPRNNKSNRKRANTSDPIPDKRDAVVLTESVTCARLIEESLGQILDRQPVPGADFPSKRALDDHGFFRLVERLARLSAVDFLAVLQAARYRRRFDEETNLNTRREWIR